MHLSHNFSLCKFNSQLGLYIEITVPSWVNLTTCVCYSQVTPLSLCEINWQLVLHSQVTTPICVNSIDNLCFVLKKSYYYSFHQMDTLLDFNMLYNSMQIFHNFNLCKFTDNLCCRLKWRPNLCELNWHLVSRQQFSVSLSCVNSIDNLC